MDDGESTEVIKAMNYSGSLLLLLEVLLEYTRKEESFFRKKEFGSVDE